MHHFLSCSSSPFWPRWRSLSEDLLWTGSTVCADGRNWPCRVCLPGKMPALLCAGVWLRRQVLREPLWGLPHRLPGEETDLCGAQQRLLLQRYHLTVSLISCTAEGCYTLWKDLVQQVIRSSDMLKSSINWVNLTSLGLINDTVEICLSHESY